MVKGFTPFNKHLSSAIYRRFAVSLNGLGKEDLVEKNMCRMERIAGQLFYGTEELRGSAPTATLDSRVTSRAVVRFSNEA